MSLESQRARAHRRLKDRERLEVKRQEYLDLLSEGDPEIREALAHLGLGVLICMRHNSSRQHTIDEVQ